MIQAPMWAVAPTALLLVALVAGAILTAIALVAVGLSRYVDNRICDNGPWDYERQDD